MGAPSRKPDIDIFRKIANACGGVLSDIAAHIGVDRVTVYAWGNDDPEFKQALEDSRERFLDLAESNLRKLVAGVPAIEKDENGEEIELSTIGEDEPEQPVYVGNTYRDEERDEYMNASVVNDIGDDRDAYDSDDDDDFAEESETEDDGFSVGMGDELYSDFTSDEE